jgi:hypothetical protein
VDPQDALVSNEDLTNGACSHTIHPIRMNPASQLKHGQRFSSLTILGLSPRRSKNGQAYYHVRCDCGITKEVRADGLRSGAVVSCGHVRVERASAATSKLLPPGSTWGRWTVIERVGSIPKRGHLYKVKCVCGKRAVIQGRHLRSARSQSCSCWYRDSRSISNVKHGRARAKKKSPEYCAYHRQRSWCRNPRDKAYAWYGAKGIAFEFENFTEFYDAVGDKPPGTWLMRKDSTQAFSADNLHWVARRNRRRSRVRR